MRFLFVGSECTAYYRQIPNPNGQILELKARLLSSQHKQSETESKFMCTPLKRNPKRLKAAAIECVLAQATGSSTRFIILPDL